MSDILETIAKRCDAIRDITNFTAGTAAESRELLLRVLRVLEPPPGLRLVIGLTLNQQTQELLTMSQTTTIALVNCANPAAATFYRGVLDLTGGTALPSLAVTSGTASLVAIVGPVLEGTTAVFNVYPTGTQNETNDAVTVTASLQDGSSVPFNFLISGNGESISLDGNSQVESWTGAPTVPSTPV